MAQAQTPVRHPWKVHRLSKNVTLDEIADVTKISKRFLEAIESGAYGQLPGGIFTTSYIKQYAATIGFDCTEILEDLTGEQATETPAMRPAPSNWGRGWVPSVAEKG